MGNRSYQNFDLLLEQLGDGQFEARVTAAPVIDLPHVRFRLPFDEKSLKILLLELDPGRSDVRSSAGADQRQAAKDFGGPLFKAIFTDGLALAWTRSLDKIAAQQGGGLRLRLRIADDAAALAGLPWELLYDARGRAFPAQSEITPLVRFLDVTSEPDPIQVNGPLRVLTIISSPTDLPELDVQREWARIETAMGPKVREGLVVVDKLPEPTTDELGDWLLTHDVHVLHFIGHGDFDSTSGEGFVFFQNDRGGADRVTADILGPFVHDHDPLRMVVLNACRGARVSAKDPYGGMAQGLVQQGATAVVAMQFPITDRAAVMFTGKFYGALAAGLPVEQAVSYARKALQAKFHSEWATPVLFMRSPDGNIFKDVQAPPGWVWEEPQATVPTAPAEVDPALAGLVPTDLDVADITDVDVTDAVVTDAVVSVGVVKGPEATDPAPDPYEFLFTGEPPADPEPDDPGPPDPGPPDPGPPEPGPPEPGPVEPGPVDPGPVDPGPVDPGPVDPGPVDPGPPPHGWLRTHLKEVAVAVAVLLVVIVVPVVAKRVFGGDDDVAGAGLPDSEMLVAAGTDFDHLNIYRVDQTSGAFKQLTSDPKSWLPVLSPDRRTMVYLTRIGNSSYFQMYTGSALEPGAGEPLLDGELTCDDVSRPAWNPATSTLVFRCMEGTTVKLVQVDEDGDNPRELLTLGAGEAANIRWIGDPTISEDGSRVVFFGNSDQTEKHRPDGALYSYSFATVPHLGLVRGEVGVKAFYSDPVFSPDGQWLAWRENLTPRAPNPDFEVYAAKILPDGKLGDQIPISNSPSTSDQDPSFSDDNQHIAYASWTSNTEQTIIVTSVDTPEDKQPLESGLPAFQTVPAWGTGR